ncbi:hypothetical protein JXQ31_07605 [candidate division KSB1 bacterium]|nr:hypothetical protein [candidate division KSB1 bacterium]
MNNSNDIKKIVNTAASALGADVIKIYNQSIQILDRITFLMIKTYAGRTIICFGDNTPEDLLGDEVTIRFNDTSLKVKMCPCIHENAESIRKIFKWTSPQCAGLNTSFGAGDRIGLATPGHIQAFKNYDIFPVLAQQSIREMSRTIRAAEEVLDDATWGVFQEGFTGGFGSDADHLKTEQDIRATIEAGFTGFTVDPSDHINNNADTVDLDELENLFVSLFDENDELTEFMGQYNGKNIVINSKDRKLSLQINDEQLKRLAVKYLPAIRFTIWSYYLIKKLKADEAFDFEMSVDETETPTSIAAHYMIVNELTQAGVKLASLAPRFVGEFQKAIDYIGDLNEFREQLRDHVAVSEFFGQYKLSIHSGSDKFSIFPIVNQVTNGLFHEKTAGTSYLEALRVICRYDTKLFREIFLFALKKFEKERYSYHITTDLSRIPRLEKLADSQLEILLNGNDSRQVLHVTFGAILTAKDKDDEYLFREQILNVIDIHEEEYYKVLTKLFCAHLDAFGINKK